MQATKSCTISNGGLIFDSQFPNSQIKYGSHNSLQGSHCQKYKAGYISEV